MLRKLLPIFIILLLAGCTKIDSSTVEYKDIVNNILISNNKNVNYASIGYKYYIPIGVNLIYDSDLNKKFKIKDTEIVLYVDIISYYYKNTLNHNEENKNIYYYSNVDDGYISIIENGEYYYLKIVYNYAKIESYVKKENLVNVISYSTIILNSITYNDNLISNFIEKGVSFGGDIKYEIDKPEDSESKFSQYLQEYVQENKKEESDILLELD